jgi:hypothetical protein
MACRPDYDLGASRVDLAHLECYPHLGETTAQVDGEPHLIVGGAACPFERSSDLSGSRFLDVPADHILRIDGVHRCGHGLAELCRVKGTHALARFEHPNVVVPAAFVNIDGGQNTCQLVAWLHSVQRLGNPLSVV